MRMHHSFLDRYSDLESPLHHLDARLKVAAAAILVCCIATLPPERLYALFAFIAFILALWTTAGLPIRFLAKRILILLPFIAIIALPAVLGAGAHAGLAGAAAIGVMLRAAAAIAAFSLLTSTTPFPKLIAALEWFRLPDIIISIASFIYRFIYILIDEFERLELGRRSREMSRNTRLAWKARAWMVGSFLIRSMERAERVHMAMLARGSGKGTAARRNFNPVDAREAWIFALAMGASILMRLAA